MLEYWNDGKMGSEEMGDVRSKKPALKITIDLESHGISETSN